MAIVNLATSQYAYGQRRLVESLRGKYDGAVYVYQSENEVGAPPHSENPYAFKVYAFDEMLKLGHTKVLWLDASVYAVKKVQPIFDWIDNYGVFMETAGHWTGTWVNQNCLDYFRIGRDHAMQMPMFSAGFLGINFENPIGMYFFSLWKQSMLHGAFKGSWDDHRHDMTCGSIIANNLQLQQYYSPAGNYFAYIGQGYSKPKDSAIFYLESGLGD